jgi:hypothetical protein
VDPVDAEEEGEERERADGQPVDPAEEGAAVFAGARGHREPDYASFRRRRAARASFQG